MRSKPWGLVCVLVILLATPILSGDEPAPTYIADPAEAAIEAALDKRLNWELIGTDLSEVAEFMSDALGVEILLDTKGLADFGIDPSVPITLKLSGVSTRSVFRLMLRDLELTYMVRDSAIWITSTDRCEEHLIMRVYPVGDLLTPAPDEAGLGECGSTVPPESDADYGTLIKAIIGNVSQDSWDVVGGRGTIEGIYNSLVISQTGDVHEQVAELLLRYRQLVTGDASPDGLGLHPLMVGLDGEAHLLPALGRPLTAIIRDEPLANALSVLAEDFHIPIVIDKRALDDFGVATNTPVSGRFAEVPFRLALKRLLDPLDLTFTARNEVIMITTHEEEEAMLQLAMYPVGKLVRDGSDDPENYDFDSLIGVITTTVAADTWAEVGGYGGIEVLLPAPTLLVSQSQEVHEEITKLLHILEAAKKRTPRKEEVDPEAITLRAYEPAIGLVDAKTIIKIIKHDSKEETWEKDNVFIEPLGTAIVVKHNAKVHSRVKKVLRELGIWIRHDAVGSLKDSQFIPQANPEIENDPPQGGGGPGGFF